jgi:hypothetical protein
MTVEAVRRRLGYSETEPSEDDRKCRVRVLFESRRVAAECFDELIPYYEIFYL